MDAPETLDGLPDDCIGLISSFLTVGQLSNVGKTSRGCHQKFWLDENPKFWKEVSARFNAVLRFFGPTSAAEARGGNVQGDRASMIRSLRILVQLYRGVYERVCQEYPDLATLLFDPKDHMSGFRIFAYGHHQELISAIHDITKQQCCGSGVLHIVRGDTEVDMRQAVSIMDASRDTDSSTVSGHRAAYCYLAEWPPQTQAQDLVVILSGALRLNPRLLERVPERLQRRVLLIHRQGTVMPNKDIVEALIRTWPRVAVTGTFCQRPNYASALGTVGISKEFYLDAVRYFSSECGAGSPQDRTLVVSAGGGGTVNLRKTFLSSSLEQPW